MDRTRSGHLVAVHEEGVDIWERPQRKEWTSGRGQRGGSGHLGEATEEGVDI